MEADVQGRYKHVYDTTLAALSEHIAPLVSREVWAGVVAQAQNERSVAWLKLVQEDGIGTAEHTSKLAFMFCDCLLGTAFSVCMPGTVESERCPCLRFPGLRTKLSAEAKKQTGFDLLQWLSDFVTLGAETQMEVHAQSRASAAHANAAMMRQATMAAAAMHGAQPFRRSAAPTHPLPPPPAAAPATARPDPWVQPIPNRNWGGCNDWAHGFAGKGAPRCRRFETKGKPCTMAPCNGAMSPQAAAALAGVRFGAPAPKHA